MQDPTQTQLIEMADQEVQAALAKLPLQLRELAGGIPVVIEALPSADLIEEGLDDDLLGLFVGEAYPDFGGDFSPVPAQIFLYVENIWGFVEGVERTFRREVRKTYLHELGHYLGLDEEDLFERGME